MEGAERTTIMPSSRTAHRPAECDSGTLRLKSSASNDGSVGIAAGATLEVKGGDYVNTGRIYGNGTLDVDGNRLTKPRRTRAGRRQRHGHRHIHRPWRLLPGRERACSEMGWAGSPRAIRRLAVTGRRRWPARSPRTR